MFGDSNRIAGGIINDVVFDVLTQTRRLKVTSNEIQVAGSTLVKWEVDTSNSIVTSRVCTWLKPRWGCWALNYDSAMDDNRVGYSGLFRDAMGVPSFVYLGPRTKRHVLWVEI